MVAPLGSEMSVLRGPGGMQMGQGNLKEGGINMMMLSHLPTFVQSQEMQVVGLRILTLLRHWCCAIIKLPYYYIQLPCRSSLSD